jgi:hypothetical protein
MFQAPTTILQAIINALETQLRLAADTSFLRDVVRDNRREMHSPKSDVIPNHALAPTVRLPDAQRVEEPYRGPAGTAVLDNLMSAEDAKWRKRRAQGLE